MGDRANCRVKQRGGDIYLYTHWGARHIAKDVQEALDFHRGRWSDEHCLTRIIFDKMARAQSRGHPTGFGIGVEPGDGAVVITVDIPEQKVTLNGELEGQYTFEEFAKQMMD